MTNNYSHSPIIEAVFEMKFSETPGWDFTIPGELYSRLREDFPVKEQRITPEFAITQDNPQEIKQEFRSTPKLAFLSVDRQRTIQISDQSLSIHQAKPYKAWKNHFETDIHRAYSVYREFIPKHKFSRLGLRFINHITLPTKEFDVPDYFNFFPVFIGGARKAASFLIGNIFQCEKTSDSCRMQLSTGIDQGTGFPLLILDLDYFSSSPAVSSQANLFSWVEIAHTEIEKLFELAITDKTRALFS